MTCKYSSAQLKHLKCLLKENTETNQRLLLIMILLNAILCYVDYVFSEYWQGSVKRKN